MSNSVVHNILSSNEIADILNDPVVQTNKEKLSTLNTVNFSIELSNTTKNKLENSLTIDLSQTTSIPMRWIKGDTLPHIDKGENNFNNTYIVYLTDSIGDLIIDGTTYPITANNAHIFSEGLEHYTINTGNSERLMIGPMSETGFRVGASVFISFTMNTFTDYSSGEGFSYYWSYANPNPPEITIFNIPPPIPDSTSDYFISDYLNPVDWTPPPGKIFGGWIMMDRPDNQPIDGNPTSMVYMPGETYNFSQTTWLIPNWIDPPISNICFTANTPINTDQGIIPIEKINPKIHTICDKKIVAITKTISVDDYLVCFEKNSIDNNIPCKRTIMSKEHSIFINGNMIKAVDCTRNYKNVYRVKYNGETLYNILLENYDKINVNNLICETLHPHNVISKLYTYFSNCNFEEQCKMIKKYNNYVNNCHNKRVTCKKL